jgi:hypothetical protein
VAIFSHIRPKVWKVKHTMIQQSVSQNSQKGWPRCVMAVIMRPVWAMQRN